MNLIGIDPGSKKTGLVIASITKSKFVIKKASVIRFAQGDKQAKTFARNLLKLYTELMQIIKKYKPACIVLEEPFIGRNPQTSIQVCWVVGVILFIAGLKKIDVFLYPASKIRKMVTGSGTSSPGRMKKIIQTTTGLRVHKLQSDVIDALSAILCHIYTYGSFNI